MKRCAQVIINQQSFATQLSFFTAADPMTPLVVECNAFSKWHEKTHGSGNGPLNLASNLYFYDTITGKMVSGVTTKVDTYSKTKDGLIIKETKQYPAGSTVESEASVTTYDAEEGKAIMAEAEAIKASLKAKSTQSQVISEFSRLLCWSYCF